MKRCKDCIYGNKDVAGLPLPQRTVRCQKNPPTVVPQEREVSSATQVMDIAGTFWPNVGDEDFCGEFEPSMEAAMGNNADREHPDIRGGRVTRPVDPIERQSDAADKVIDGVSFKPAGV